MILKIIKYFLTQSAIKIFLLRSEPGYILLLFKKMFTAVRSC